MSWITHGSHCARLLCSDAQSLLCSQVLEGDVKALAQSTTLPYRGMKRQTSSMSKLPSLGQPQVAPRDHA